MSKITRMQKRAFGRFEKRVKKVAGDAKIECEIQYWQGVMGELDAIFGKGDIVPMHVVEEQRAIYRGRIAGLRAELGR